MSEYSGVSRKRDYKRIYKSFIATQELLSRRMIQHMEGLKPFFQSSDTGSHVYMLEGEPKYLDFRVNDNTYKIPLPDMLEIYKIFNGVWYSGLWRMLDICVSGFCGKPSGHIREETCPQMTEYEKRVYDDYLRQMRTLHMAENRPPIADGTTSDNAQPDSES